MITTVAVMVIIGYVVIAAYVAVKLHTPDGSDTGDFICAVVSAIWPVWACVMLAACVLTALATKKSVKK